MYTCFNNIRQLELFQEQLPAWPYCTDSLDFGIHIQPKAQAIAKKYIQHNPKNSINWIVVDVDRPGGGHDWELREAPSPNIVAENPENLHAHLFYGLGIPVHKNPDSQIKPLRYAASIQLALIKKLGGDYGYGGLISKNPLSRYWNVRTYQEYLYDLPWLAEYVDLEPYRDRRKRLPAYGLGRNCTVFERLRLWAYRAILKVDWPSFDSWYAACMERAVLYNDFTAPLPFGEVKSVAKSVSRWVWGRFTPEEFAKIQKERNKKSVATRRKAAEEKRQYLLALRDGEDMSIRDLAEKSGIPRSTVYRLLTSVPFTISARDPEFTQNSSSNWGGESEGGTL